MKSLMYVLAVTMMLTGMSLFVPAKSSGEKGQFYQFVTSNEPPDKDVPIVITIREPGHFSAGIFGCWGPGFCLRDHVLRVKGRTATTTKNENGTLTIGFLTSAFNTENAEYYAGRRTFEIPEASELYPEECEGLGLPNGTSIQPGSYKITRTEERLLITVPIE